MDRISLTGIEVWAHHGVLDHERATGQRFGVDVHIDTDLTAAGANDDLADTLDYGVLAQRVHDAVAQPPAALIETVAARVCEILLADARVRAVEVTVHKPSAPMPVPVADVSVTLLREQPEQGTDT